MTALAQAHDAVNLGQGFPDEDGPAAVLEAARAAVAAGHNQYAPGPGIPALREAVAAHGARFHGLTHDPDTEVSVTFGATEALSATLLALVDPGDEVVVVEPSYDAYDAAIALAGGRRVPVPLTPPAPGSGGGATLDLDRLAAAVTDRTRVLVLNSPHNPTGSALGDEELAGIARLLDDHPRVVVVSDEVYEHLVFDGPHRSIAQQPGMRERTVRVSSAAKTFSVTGWKVGWACAPADLTAGIRLVKSYTTFSGATPFQHAVALALGLDDTVFEAFRADFAARRDHLVAGLRAAGLDVAPPAGTYFVAADAAPLGVTDGVAFCRELPARAGVAAIPVGVFCEEPGPWASWVRFATCKRREVLDEGVARLAALADA
ncbi:MAG: aminotransferase class I/II-fold pyridoxal phosphate-dependent enzyme [Actinomycetes bacterium]